MSFTREELEACYGRQVPDLLPEPLRLLFVGINPSLSSAAAGAHFATRGNRFYPALAAAGIIPEAIDASAGYPPEGLAWLREAGVGVTNIVPAATARADELSREQLRAGAAELGARIARLHPRVVAILGITAYRTAFARPRAVTGAQPETIAWDDGSGASRLFVLPNPSGLNAHETVASLGRAYAEAARAAGTPLRAPVAHKTPEA